ncbi:MAG: IPT/TIG domain-containing protein [Armatimonadota bacterium]
MTSKIPPGYTPLEGATVTVVTQNLSQQTDSQGHAEILGITAGSYSVTITKEGYQGVSFGNVAITNTAITLVGDSLTGVQTQISSNPAITNLNSTSGQPDSSVTITGYNFGATQEDSTVTFNGTDATITSWSDTQIVCTVPGAATSGNVLVTVDGNSSNGVSFTVLPLDYYTVSYNGNSNTGGTVPIDRNNYEEGDTVTVLANTGTLIRINDGGASYRYIRWNTAADGSGTDYNPAATFAMGSANVTLYAKWTAYALRDTGPAGGLIFYIADDYSAGWRYMECAPASTEWDDNKEWGVFGVLIGGTETAIGTGQANTAAIIAVQGAGSTYAAQLCDGLEHGGYSDWFLPSKDELHKMYTELKENGVGDFTNVNYWSSSELDENDTWIENFNVFAHSQFPGNKNVTHSVRAARRF